MHSHSIFHFHEPFRLICFESNNSSSQWREGHFQIPSINSDFQIVFEAFESNGNICDIAIDDVALQKYDDTTSEQPMSTQAISGIFDWESCASRCTETDSERVNGNRTFEIQNGQIIEKCDCHLDCVTLGTCCLDFEFYCSDGESNLMFIT